jgi:ATP-dependent Clp protease ATP-binding subunit ClpA
LNLSQFATGSHTELAKRLDELETTPDKKIVGHDKAIAAILSAIRELMTPGPQQSRGIGFTANIESTK